MVVERGCRECSNYNPEGLAGHHEGRAALADPGAPSPIRLSSAPNWTDRTKSLAARAPGLDIFTQALVLREMGLANQLSVERCSRPSESLLPVTSTKRSGPKSL